MKIALIGPELEENLALRHIHAAAVEAGHGAVICDFHATSQIPEVIAQVLAYQPEAVGLSMVFTARAREYVRLAEALRAAGYRGYILAGGHFACFHAAELLRDVPAIDAVLHGEGERAVPDLLEHLGELEKVTGLTYRKAGRIETTGPRPPVQDLDTLPYPTRPERFHCYFDLPIANMLSGRGCFANCDFCSINAWHRQIGGARFRQRKVANLADEMAGLYHDRGVRMFNFHDDNFFLPSAAQNEARFHALHQALAARGVGRIGIQVKARPDTVEPQSMAALKELGLFRVFLGVESNSVAGLKALGRGIHIEQNLRALELLKGMGLHVTFNLLMFEPECTLADLRDNIAFIRAQAEVPLNFCRTEVYSGTALEQRLRAAHRLEGDYFGYGYAIRDPQSQRAYEMFRQVFTPRNFALAGMNLQAMTLDYYFHVLRHFYPQAAPPELHQRVQNFIRALNVNNAELLEHICAFARQSAAGETAATAKVVATLAQERVAFDAAAAPRCQAMLAEMRAAAQATRRPGWHILGPATRAAAVVAVLVTVLGCDSHIYEMAPAPQTLPAPGTRPGGESPATKTLVEAGVAQRAAIRPTSVTQTGVDMSPREMVPAPIGPPPMPVDVAPFEMVAVPPATEPTTTPQTGPATMPQTGPATTQATPPAVAALPADDAAKIGRLIATAEYSEPLLPLATKYGMADKTVLVYLELAKNGAVTRCDIQMAGKEHAEFQAALREKILAWTFPKLTSAGSCTVELSFRQQLDTHPNEIAPLPHPTEMVPEHHMTEMAPKPLKH